MNQSLVVDYPRGALGARYLGSTPAGTLIPATEAPFTPLDIFNPAGSERDLIIRGLWMQSLSVASIAAVRYQQSIRMTTAAGTGGTALDRTSLHSSFTDTIAGLRMHQWAAGATSPTLGNTIMTAVLESDEAPSSAYPVMRHRSLFGMLPDGPITLQPGEGVAIHCEADSGLAAGLWSVWCAHEIRRNTARGGIA